MYRQEVKRMIGISEEGEYVLQTPLMEELDAYPLILFEGENYISYIMQSLTTDGASMRITSDNMIIKD